MDGRGRHVSSGSSAFVRDLVVMAVGIVIVGVLLYGGLSLIAGLGSDDEPQVAGTTTSATEPTTSTQPTTTASSAPSTTESTTTTVAETTTTTIAVRPPGEVTVLVLNSTGRAGIAAALTSQLGAAGYQTLQPDNYDPALDQSRVWFVGDFGPEAAELQADLVPDAIIEIYEGPDLGADIVVVLGASFAG